MPATLERRYVLELPVDPLPLTDAVARISEAIAHGTGAPLRIVTLNAEMAMQAQADPELAEIIKGSGLVVPDGSGVIWALKRQGLSTAKVAGVDLLAALAAEGARKGYRFYFIGAKPGVAAAAGEALKARFPGFILAGARDGYFTAEDEPAVLEGIREARPDVLLAALGVPRQEKWLAQHQGALGVPVVMGVGGSFDVFAGNVKRAPFVFQKLHLEWLFRLIQEPWRYQRMQSTLPRFVREVLKRG